MRLAPVACALLLVLAGCGGVAGPAPETATPTEEASTPSTAISVVGGDYPVDPETVFARVLNLTDQRVAAPVVYIESPDESSPEILDRTQSPFRTALGFVPPERTNDSDGLRLGAYTPAQGNSVHVYKGVTRNATFAETTLAHEFVHTVQFQTGWGSEAWNTQPTFGGSLTDDGYQAYYLLLEGSAEYVEHRYRQRFVPEGEARAPWKRGAYENASAYERWNLARYTLGAEYVAEEIDSPAGIESLYEEPPRSTEQILHNTDDGIKPLSVADTDTGNWSAGTESAMGELFLRIALRTELNRSTAVAAAHGWGNDRRITYERGNDTATAWVLRWDDAANATEFRSAFERYLDAKATRNGGVWRDADVNASYRVQRPTGQHVAVFLGNDSFVRRANVTSISDITVELTVGNESAAPARSEPEAVVVPPGRHGDRAPRELRG